MKSVWLILLTLTLALAPPAARADPPPTVRVGSKVFTESVILAEIATQLARSEGVLAEHQRQLGGTRILFNALLRGEIDLYPEYTGTISEEIFAGRNLRDLDQIRTALQEQGIAMTRSLGFSDTYAIGMRQERAAQLGIKTLSDLQRHPELKLGFSNEFMDRKDGWPGLRQRYSLPQQSVRGMDHDLAYRALQSGAIDAMDLYSTDAEIRYYHLVVLEDDLHYFPDYQAVYLYRADLQQRAPAVIAAMQRLEGQITPQQMIAMNARAKLDKIPETDVARDYIAQTLGISTRATRTTTTTWWPDLLQRTREHLWLVCLSLLAAIVIAVPLGIISAKYLKVGQVILGAVAVLYTIPSLALLVFMIPLLGIGARPAIVALFLYSLLPIVRNTYQGLREIPLPIRESAIALGLPAWYRLLRVELPMASGSILAGIKTAAVINVGTATLGALIGAGGYGQPILTGIRLDSVPLILQGAVPAALLALAAQGLFELAELVIVPRGLRKMR